MRRNPGPGAGDHRDDMRRMAGLDAVTSEALVTGSGDVPADFAPLADALAGLRDVAAEPPPTPSSELAALLTDGVEPVPPVVAAPTGRRRRVRLGMVGVLTAGALVGGAAAGALPRPLQEAVNRLVEAVRPSQATELPSEPAVRPSGTPAPASAGETPSVEPPSAPPTPRPAVPVPPAGTPSESLGDTPPSSGAAAGDDEPVADVAPPPREPDDLEVDDPEDIQFGEDDADEGDADADELDDDEDDSEKSTSGSESEDGSEHESDDEPESEPEDDEDEDIRED